MFIVPFIRKILPLPFLAVIPGALNAFLFNMGKYRVGELPGNVGRCFYFPLFLDCLFSFRNSNFPFSFFPFLSTMRCLPATSPDVLPGTHKARQILIGNVKFDIKFGKLDFLPGQTGRDLPDDLAGDFGSSFHLFKYNFIDY